MDVTVKWTQFGSVANPPNLHRTVGLLFTFAPPEWKADSPDLQLVLEYVVYPDVPRQ